MASTELVPLSTGSPTDDSLLAYVLSTDNVSEYLGSRTESATRSHQRVAPSTILRLDIPWPAKAIRGITVDYLDRETAEIDSLVSDLQRALSLRKERLESSIDRSFLDASYTDISLKRFGISIAAGVSVNASTYPAAQGDPGVLKTGSVSKGYFDPTENKAVEEPHEIARLSTPVQKGTIIVNRANTPDLVGSAALVDRQADDLYLSDLLWQVHVECADAAFVAAYMQTRAYRDSIDLIRVGSSVSMQKISQENFANIPVPSLPIEHQRLIAGDIDQARREFRAAAADIDRAITLAKERRAALITAAVTGQIDVTAKRRPAAEQLEDDIKELS